MSGLDKNRLRNITVCFRASPNENQIINSRIKVSGKPKAEYIIETLLEGSVHVTAGRYHSDRLSLEIRRLKDALEIVEKGAQSSETLAVLEECKILLSQLITIILESSSNKGE